MDEVTTQIETPVDTKAEAVADAFDALLARAEIEDVRGEIAALKAQVGARALAGARPPLDGAKAADPARTAFVERYLRRGIDSGVELKSITGTTTTDGGFAVPREIDALIATTLKGISPIRAIANVVQTGTSGYRKLVARGGVASGWVAETSARPETATPTFAEIVPAGGTLYANPAASQAMLEDAMFDVEAWVANEIAIEFAKAEGAAFISGNGTNRPKGFLTQPTTTENDTIRAFGTVQYVASGAAGNFAAASPQDRLVDLVHALRAPYRQGAVWVMSSDTLARIRKMKTSDGAFIWQPAVAEGQPSSLLGYPVVEAADMPDVAADSLSIAFGNFREAYVVADRGETTLLRDPFSNKPFVHFYATKRVSGAVVNSEALKVMKFAAT
jgi:HK97 family phage major capsid protein